MKHFILSILLVAFAVTPLAASANIIVDSRQPEIYYSVDGEAVGENYAIHSTFTYTNPRDKENQDNIVYRCSEGWCGLFYTGKDREAYTYSLEEFSEDIPDTAIKDKGVEYWVKYNYYLNNSESVVNSYDMTEVLRTVDYSSKKDIIDYYIDVDSTTGEVTVEEVNSGPYDPLAELEDHKAATWPMAMAVFVFLSIVAAVIVPIVVVKIIKK